MTLIAQFSEKYHWAWIDGLMESKCLGDGIHVLVHIPHSLYFLDVKNAGVCMLSCVRLFVNLWTLVCQAPQSIGCSWEEYWSGLPFPSPGELPNPGIEPVLAVPPALQVDSLHAEPSGMGQNG